MVISCRTGSILNFLTSIERELSHSTSTNIDIPDNSSNTPTIVTYPYYKIPSLVENISSVIKYKLAASTQLCAPNLGLENRKGNAILIYFKVASYLIQCNYLSKNLQ